MNLRWLSLVLLTGSAWAQSIDPAQLDVPWPKHSFYKQPWRAFLETKSGDDFLRGIGINYNVPTNHEAAVRLLAEAGFKNFRIEIGWGGLNWDETGFNNSARVRQVLALCNQYGIRPTILLNANHGVPCPTKFFKRRLAADAPQGSRSVKLTDTSGILVNRTGLSQLTGYWAAEAIIVGVDSATGECKLSKPLPKDLPATNEVTLATLKYLPLYPVGTPEFDETAAGWLRYAAQACQLVRAAGIEAFDVELWNELSFGSNFTAINHYYNPPLIKSPKNFLHEGGSAWELARRTIAAVKTDYPHARCIWGFSNTTFFHTPIAQLPPQTDGQSYHPYGTGTRKLPADEQHRDRPQDNLEGFTPTLEIRMPEGWGHTFVQTESLMRLLNPAARQQRPPGTARFFQYMTEHGVAPPECNVHDADGAWLLKAKCALRSFCFWLNKGVDVLDYYCAYDRDALGMGLLPPDKNFAAPPPPLTALRNLTRAFAGSVPLASVRQLQLDVTELSAPRKIFDGDAQHPPLWTRDVFAALPFQVNEQKFIIAAYVMSFDVIAGLPEARYRLAIKNLPDTRLKAELYDPLTDRKFPVRVAHRDRETLTVDCPVTDCPRLLILSR